MNLKVFSLVLLVVGVALAAVVLLVGSWGESDDELSCGSVGRLVATAEAIASEEGSGSAYVRIGNIRFLGGETLSVIVSQGKDSPTAWTKALKRAGPDSYAYLGPETICQALNDLTKRFDWNIDDLGYGIDTTRVLEIEAAYEDKPNDATNFRVYRGWRDGVIREREMLKWSTS